MWPWAEKHDRQYLKAGRLSDVVALIQVLGLDLHAHRSEDGLRDELQGPPMSAESWTSIAKEHPEFFRVRRDGEHRISLISRHVLPKTEHGTRELPPGFAGELMTTAVDLHDRQVRRSERWTYLVPIWVTLIAGACTILAVVAKWWLGCAG